MRFLFKLLGLILLLAGVYFLGQNIYFSTNVYPYPDFSQVRKKCLD
ncbi:hypothetical protein COO91_09392 (plasmid) [Nostoc flagelliforme CCNUN1]|uniref:Uncharacterized protein n=1 Tax=Nostoc flagelliforme CCNUN1 TaxID=2038116 RepID=A0A2K8T6E0_9NOSO|nr:hypothetical protein COO91_09392 [Nostoc flagelliforme CCNUN1]